jgi:hypothetical protein
MLAKEFQDGGIEFPVEGRSIESIQHKRARIPIAAMV